MIPGLRPIESAVAACLLDGLMQRETAKAIGCSRARVQFIETWLAGKFGARSRAALVLRLTVEADR